MGKEIRVFKRKLYDKLVNWKITDNGRTAVLIEGARRVGKSTLVEKFAKNEYESYILIDFSKASKEVFSLFEDISDLNYLFLRLKLIYNVQLFDRKSVIIFDEVQMNPLARQAIKHLVADGRYDYIETGSLISIKKNIKNILLPSEEKKLHLYPLDYEEFRWALGDNTTFPLLREVFKNKTSLGQAVNRKMMRDLRLYMLVGGMPQAVSAYIESNDLAIVDNIKRTIIQLYSDDFLKVDPTGQISALFNAIPAQLNSNSSRYQIGSIIGNNFSDNTISGYISEMQQSMTVNLAYHVDDPSSGMSLTKNLRKYKMFIGDTGLFVTLAFKDKEFTENIIYQKLLTDKLGANLGYCYENLIAQMLKAAGNDLYYHTFPDGNGHNYEVDFLITRKDKVCPIEVKSSGYKRHTSMDEFCRKYPERIDERYLFYTKDLKKEKQITYLPVFLAPFV